MFTMLFFNFPDPVKREVKEICASCGQNLILEENSPEKVPDLIEASSIDCFFFWLSSDSSTTNAVISQIRRRKEYLYTPMLFFSFQIETLLSTFVQWKSSEFFYCPLGKEKKAELAALLQYYDELYRKIHFDTVFHCNINTSKEIFSVPYRDILFVESTMKKSVLHTKKDMFILPVPLYRVREKLPASFFVQTHRSFIVNTKNISCIDKSKDPWVITFFDSEQYAYVSRNYKKDISMVFSRALDCQSN